MATITHLFPGGFQPPTERTEHTEDPDSLFKNALRAGGLVPPDSLKVGAIDRVDLTDEPRGRKSGWYIYFTDGVASGSFGSWKDDSKSTWVARDDLTPAEQAIHNRSMELARQAREEAHRLRQAQAQATARAHLEASTAAPDNHTYLTRKGIPASGARVSAGDDLLIPIVDTEGEIHSYQKINPEGSKRFLSGGQSLGRSS